MKWLATKKRRLIISAILLAVAYIIITNFILHANIGYLAGDIFDNLPTPTHIEYINAFANPQINWEMAYWSAMISEFTYAKPSYPSTNLALTALGFTTTRHYSFFKHNGEYLDDLMVDIGTKQISSNDMNFTLKAIAFRGSVPLALESPTTRENMRRNMDFLPRQWAGTESTVHRGFYNQFNDFVEYILPEITALTESCPHTKFWITGHSMGGALAELFALWLIENGTNPQNIMIFGFATPLVASRQLQEHARQIGAADRIFRFAHRQDMVGYVGYRIFFGRTIAADCNNIMFGRQGVFDRSHHSLPRIYLPFIVSQIGDSERRKLFEMSLNVNNL